MTDVVDGLPYASIGVPGRDLGLKLLLDRDADGDRASSSPSRTGSSARTPTGSRSSDLFTARRPATRRRRRSRRTSACRSGCADFGEFTLLIAKRDPGQGLVWIAFACLIAGITITFYLPRRRVWTRLAPDGRLAIVWRSDRYVDVEREFGRLLDQLVAARRPA